MNHTRALSGMSLILGVVLVLLISSCNMPIGGATATPIPTPTIITLPPSSAGSIVGLIWHDLCAVPGEGQAIPEPPPEGCVPAEGGGFRANGIRETDEPGIEGLEISLGIGACPSTGYANAVSDVEGEYVFENLDASTYCPIVDPAHPKNAQILLPGEWTAGPADSSGLISISIDLEGGEHYKGLEFGWDYQFLPPYEPLPTNTPAPTETPEPTYTPTPTEEGTATPTPEGTAISGDPNLPTGNPDWKDTFDNSGNWSMANNKWIHEGHASFEIKNGNMVMTAFNPDYVESWMFTWPDLSGAYLEGVFTTGECSGGDRYGLRFRSSDTAGDGIGYSFGVTCDGRYSLRNWDGEEFKDLIPWTSSDQISQGSGKTMRLGVLTEGTRLTLYIDRIKVGETQDSTYSDGKFGLFIGSGETDNFEVEVDEIAYWLLN